MNTSNLIKQDPDGKYCILFQNRHSFEIEEIEQIFSQFGKVCRIQCAGDIRGYRFIRYRLYEEVERAIEGLKNHPKIKLVEHRPKNKNNQENQSIASINKEENINSNSVDKKEFNYKNNSKNNQQNKISKSKQDNEKNNDEYEQFTKENTSEELPFNDRSSISSETSSIHTKMSHIKKYLKKGCVGDHQKDNLPDLIGPKKTILDAEEIIVGNIHPDYGACYILHLLDPFEPIAISDIKTVPKSGSRYCHVYFKSLQDSIGVETQFDRYDLSGKKLVVLRPCRLMEEGTL